MNNIRNLPWFRFAAEGVAIIVSILIAFAIDAWWDERKERLEEGEILQGLQNEYTRHRERLQSRVKEQVFALNQAGQLLEAAQAGEWTGDAHSLDVAIFWIGSAPTTELGSGVRDALISGGRLSLLSNRDLRFQLATWDRVIEEVQDDELMARSLAFDLITPYFARHGIHIASPFSTHEAIGSAMATSDLPNRLRSVTDNPEEVDRLINDPEFEVMVEFRFSYLAHLGTEYKVALDAVDEILANIESNLADMNQ